MSQWIECSRRQFAETERQARRVVSRTRRRKWRVAELKRGTVVCSATAALIACLMTLSACGSSGNLTASPTAAPTKTAIPMITIVTPTPGTPSDTANNSAATRVSGTTPTPAQSSNGQNGKYTVQPGDTLYGIAVHFNVSIQALMSANSITNPSALRAGQVIVIPGK